MSNECKCLNPDGGGTKCPPQHVALCIRGRDRECYGECVPIPINYSRPNSSQFIDWLNDSIRSKVLTYLENNYEDYAKSFNYNVLEKVGEDTSNNGGVLSFQSNVGIIRVRYSFELINNILLR
jgi:hypothetical protein